MALNRERITLNPLEEDFNNIPLELGGDRWGQGVFIQPKGSTWAPPSETPQVATSVDTEGGVAAATTIGLRDSPVLKIQVVEPTDPAMTNYSPDPQTAYTASGHPVIGAQNSASVTSVLIRDLTGFDYAMFVNATAANGGVAGAAATVPAGSAYTGGIWLKGAAGGEAVSLQLTDGAGHTATSNVVLTAQWQWYTVYNSFTWAGVSANVLVLSTSGAASFYATGFAIVQGPSLAEYFDGTFPGCAWTGTPHNSTSTRPASGGPRLNAIMADVEQAVAGISKYRSGTIRRTLPASTGANTRVTYDLIGATLSWDDTSMMNAGTAQGTINFVAEPYGRGPEMGPVYDPFLTFVTPNYTMDSGLAADLASNGLALTCGANPTAEHRLISTGGSPYPLYSGEVSAQFTPGTTISGWKGGVIIERSSATTYIEAYVTDNGANSLFNVDKVLNGTRTNVLTTTLGARVATGTAYTIRVRAQRQNNNDQVYAEYFSGVGDPVPTTTTPTAALGPYTITDAVFSAPSPGYGGAVWTPQSANATFTKLRISPYLARERSLPVLRFGLAGVPGTAPGLGRLSISEDSNNDQYWATWGWQADRIGRLSAATDLFYEAEALTPQAGAAVVTGNSGASGGGTNNVVRQTHLTTTPTSMLSTKILSGTQLAHIGAFSVYARVFVPTSSGGNHGTVSLALQWGAGDLQSWTTNNAVSTSTPGVYAIVNLGPVRAPAAVGTQQWQGRVLASSTSPNDSVDIDCLWLVPLDDGGGTFKGTFAAPSPPATFVGQDPLNSAGAAALGTTTGVVGGAWTTGGGSATDFAYNGSNALVRAVSDPAGDFTNGRYAVLGASQTAAAARVDMKFGLLGGSVSGLLLRFTSLSNFLFVGFRNTTALQIWRMVAGVALGAGTAASPNLSTNAFYTLQAEVDNSGRVSVYFGPQGAPTLVATAQDAVLATGGALAAGNLGIYDHGSGAFTRTYANYWSSTFASDAAIYAGRVAEIRSDRANRQDPTGALWTPPSSYVGQYARVPGQIANDGLENLIVKASRNDPVVAGDTGIDAIEAQVSVTPRYAQIANL